MLALLAAVALSAAAAGLEQAADPMLSADPYVRARAVQRLGESGDRRYLAEVRRALDDAAPVVQCRALEAAAKLGDVRSLPVVLARLESPYRSVRGYALWAAGELRDPSALSAVLPYLRERGDPDLAGFALEAASKLGTARIQGRLTPFLRHADRRLRDAAAQALAELGDEGVLDELFAQLDRETDLQVQRALARALGRIGGAHVASQFAHMLKDERVPARQGVAAEAFRSMGAAGAVALGEILAEKPSPTVKVLAVRALGELPSSLANGHLVRLLDDEDARVRSAALEALGPAASPRP